MHPHLIQRDILRSVILESLQGIGQDDVMTSARMLSSVILTIECLDEHEWSAATRVLGLNPDDREALLCIRREMGGPEEMVAGFGAGGENSVMALASAQRKCGVAMEDGPGSRPEIKVTKDPATKAPEPTLPTPTPANTLVINVAEIPEGIPEYDRSGWKHWVDEDRDCQDARQGVLIEESLLEVTLEIDRECRVAQGDGGRRIWHTTWGTLSSVP